MSNLATGQLSAAWIMHLENKNSCLCEDNVKFLQDYGDLCKWPKKWATYKINFFC